VLEKASIGKIYSMSEKKANIREISYPWKIKIRLYSCLSYFESQKWAYLVFFFQGYIFEFKFRFF